MPGVVVGRTCWDYPLETLAKMAIIRGYSEKLEPMARRRGRRLEEILPPEEFGALATVKIFFMCPYAGCGAGPFKSLYDLMVHVTGESAFE